MAAKTGKSTKATKKGKKNAYVRDSNPALQKVVRGLRSLVKASAPGTKMTVNSGGIPTFESKDPFCFYIVGKITLRLDFTMGLRWMIQRVCSREGEKICAT
jgi:hypothetical protein